MTTLQTSFLKEAFDVLAELEQLQGRTVKEKLIKQHKDNLELQAIVKMALGQDRYFVTPPQDCVGSGRLSLDESWQKFLALAQRLCARDITGNAAYDAVEALLTACPADAAKWFTRILNHDLRVGIGTDVSKSIWGPYFLLGDKAVTENWTFNGCALAKTWEDVYPKGEAKFPLGVERKLDGERALLFIWPTTGELIVTTRNAKRRDAIESVPEFKRQLVEFARSLNGSCGADLDRPVLLDGEFMAQNWNQTSSLIRRTKNFNAKEFLDNICVRLFDWSPVKDYLAGVFSMPWVERKARLILAARGVTQWQPIVFSPNIQVLGHVIVHNQDELQAAYEMCIDAGDEGIVAKVMDAPELFKRTANNIKLKPSDTLTVTITGAVAGQGKHAAALAKFIVAVAMVLDQYGKPQDDGVYLRWTFGSAESAEAAAQQLRKVVADDADRRIEVLGNVIELRHGERLGYFTALTAEGDEIHVGGGYKHKAGGDQRMEFWLNRAEMIGTKIDVKVQQDKEQVGIGRFNRFVRVRDDV
jgi:DNA ligase-1